MAAQTRLDNAILAVSGTLLMRKMCFICGVKVGPESGLMCIRYEQLTNFIKFDAPTLDMSLFGTMLSSIYAAHSILY